MNRLSTYIANEAGASAAEYALILGFVAIGIIGGLTLLGQSINSVLGVDSNAIASTSS